MFIPSYINDILNILYTNGFSAFLVGGCVRDYILGRSTNDYDITTNATPSEMLGLFGGYEISDCGIKHGTVCVIICGHMVEITTFRKDVGYDDNRHPNKVFFANNLEDDLARRDFTINAMAYSQQTGIVDIFGGINDIEKGIIRCVGDPVVRFNEDALRIMRCVRFSSQLGFNIERSTYEAMEQCKQNIAFLSKERILSELYKTLCGDFVADTMLKNRDIIFEIIPELKPADGFNQNSPYHIYDVFEHTIRTIPHVPKDNALRLTMLLHDIGKPVTYTEDKNGIGHFYNHGKKGEEISKKILDRLRVSNNDKKLILTLIRYHSDVITDEKSNIKTWLKILGKEDFIRLLHVRYADCMAKERETSKQNLLYLSKICAVFKDIMDNDECYCIKQLSINGDDILNLHICPPQKIGQLLDFALNAVIEERAENKKDNLIRYIKKLGNMV